MLIRGWGYCCSDEVKMIERRVQSLVDVGIVDACPVPCLCHLRGPSLCFGWEIGRRVGDFIGARTTSHYLRQRSSKVSQNESIYTIHSWLIHVITLE